MKEKWEIYSQNHQIQKMLSQQINISLITSQVLINRGITDPEEAKIFLSPQLSNLHPPLLMKDMNKAVERIIFAINKKEKIIIYGDYDVDGITAVSVLIIFLREAGADVSFRIPERDREGYGLNKRAIKEIKEQGISLLITVDCGISDYEEVALARDFNIDIIITDHHEVPDRLPPAFAILNPHQTNCQFPCKHLAGVGVAFYLIIGLRAELRKSGFWKNQAIPNLKKYLDLVALGTIADVVPLTGVNRIFVKFGLDELSNTSRAGIVALKEVSGLSNSIIDTEKVGYRLSPRINAGGRMFQADDGVRLLTTDDALEAERMAKKLDEKNTNRQQIEGSILKEAISVVEKDRKMLESKIIVLVSKEWHPGVIGIVASRLVNKYYKPTVLFFLKDGKGKGSARSIESFNLFKGLIQCEEFLENYGGHSQAAGLTVMEENLANFKTHFEKVVDSQLVDEDFIPRLYIDVPVNLEAISEKLINELELLAPFGHGNSPPVFIASKLESFNFKVVGRGHLKFKVKDNKRIFDAIGFGMGEFIPNPDHLIQVAFTPQINNWQNTRTIQLKLKDISSDV